MQTNYYLLNPLINLVIIRYYHHRVDTRWRSKDFFECKKTNQSYERELDRISGQQVIIKWKYLRILDFSLFGNALSVGQSQTTSRFS